MAGEETLGTAVLALSTDDKGLDKGLDAGEKKAQGWVGRVGGVLGKGLAVGAGVAIGAGVALTAVLGDAVREAMNAQEVGAQLDAVLQSTGGAAGMTADEVNDLATSLSEVTRFEDDAIVAGESMLLTFTNIGEDVFPQATETMLDMSQALGQDMQTSAVQLGKALNDPIKGVTALQRVGVTFTEAQKDQIKAMVEAGDVMGAQKVILAELSKEFGGSARAAGQTFGGQMDILKNKIGNVKEEVGMALLPVLTQLATALGPVLMEAAQGLANFLTNTLIPAISDVVTWVTENWPKIRDTAIAVWNAVVAVVGPILETIKGLLQDAGESTSWLSEAWQRVQAIIAAVLPPIQTIIEAVLGAISTFVAEHGDEIKAFMDTAWEAIGSIINTVLAIIEATIVPALQAIAQFISDHGAEIQRVLSAAWTIISTIISTALTLIEGTVKLILALIQGDWSGAWNIIKTTTNTVWENIKTIIRAALDMLKALIGGALDAIKGIFESKWNAILSYLKGLWESIKQTVQDGLNAVKDALGSIKFPNPFAVIQGWIDSARSAIDGFLTWLRGLKIPNPFANFKIPTFATGTSFAPGGLALVGELGPELVNLPRGSQVIPAADTRRMMGGDTLIFQFAAPASVYDERRIEASVERALANAGRRADSIQRMR